MEKVAGDEITLPVVTVTLTAPGFAIRAAGTRTVSCALLFRVVGESEVVPHVTVVPEVKFAPLIVSVNPGPPALAELGLRLLIVDAGLMVKVAAAEVTPPVITVTFTLPAAAIRAASTGAVIIVVPVTVGVREVEPHFTVVPEVKFAPLIVSVNAGPPAVAELGLRLLIVDAGLMVKVAAAEVTPPVVTITLAVPALAIRAAVTGTVIFVIPETAGFSEVVSHFTVVPEVKFAPLIVSVNAGPPAVAELGLKLLIVDAGLIVKVAAAEVTPPVVTATLAVPGFAIRSADTGAVIFVVPVTVAFSDVVPHFTVVPEVKFAPLIVSVNAGPPAVAELGLKLLIVDAGLIVKTAAADVTPPVVAVTFAVPTLAIRAAGTGAVIFVVPVTVGFSDVVFHFTVDPEVKFAPLIVSVNPGPPATAELGLKLIVGTLIVKTAAADVTPPVVTVTFAVPGLAIRAAVTGTVIFVVPVTVGFSHVVPHFTVDPEVKFAPLIVRVNPGLPATAELGLKLMIVDAACAAGTDPSTRDNDTKAARERNFWGRLFMI
jgi:hypothetical protein